MAEKDTQSERGEGRDARTSVTVLIALGANVAIALAKAAAGLLAGSPAMLSEAAHSVADTLNEVFLLVAVRRSKRPADEQHPFGYGKERYFWALLAAVGIFVMGGCFSMYQGIQALRTDEHETMTGYVAGLVVLGISFFAEGTSLARALLQARREGAADPAVRTVIAEDTSAVAGVLLAAAGIALHMTTGNVVWEGGASIGIGLLLVYAAYRLAREARDQLIGEAVDPELTRGIKSFLAAQPEIDTVAGLLTMKLGMDSMLVAARIDLVPGIDSEEVELVCVRIKRRITEKWPEANQVFLDITEAPGPEEKARSAGVRSRSDVVGAGVLGAGTGPQGEHEPAEHEPAHHSGHGPGGG
ncbi:cation diffusion facilitator family transporter [Streptomyces sp. NPDC005423]|uniref:cation diffusion facilitator family transporter n=1 Tax=Streptomyces sp. NPDC005423 TaxID=3155343 RepID=UPI0033BAD72E